MGLYAVIKGDRVDGIAIADSPLNIDGEWVCVDGLDPRPGSGFRYIDGAFHEPEPVEIEPVPRIISQEKFRLLLTDSEYLNILQSSKTDVEVEAWVLTFNMIKQVNLDDERTKSWLEMLNSKGLISDSRKEEILNTQV
jgi:hypothetical protein